MKLSITDIPGIGEVAAAALAEHGIRTLRKLAGSSIAKVAEVPGFSTARAAKVIAEAARLASPGAPDESAASPVEAGQEGSKGKPAGNKKKGKGKDKKKGKGKHKGKNKGKGRK